MFDKSESLHFMTIIRITHSFFLEGTDLERKQSWPCHVYLFLSYASSYIPKIGCRTAVCSLMQGGEPDINAVAKMVLNDFQRGKLPYFVKPPIVSSLYSWSIDVMVCTAGGRYQDSHRFMTCILLIFNFMAGKCAPHKGNNVCHGKLRYTEKPSNS